MAGVPEDRAPIVKFRLGLPATYNHPELSESIAGAWKKELGEQNVLLRKPVMGSEDFGGWEGRSRSSCSGWGQRTRSSSK